MKRKFILLLLILVVSITFVGCGNSTDASNTDNNNESVVSFDSITLDGTKVDSSIFNESDLTMINIWATYCGPCIDEISDIQILYDQLKNKNLNVNIIGILSDAFDKESDTPNKEKVDLAIRILEDSGAKYLNVIPDQKFIDSTLKDVNFVPTTIFVDSNGKIVDEFVVGAKGREEYKKEITDRLDILNK